MYSTFKSYLVFSIVARHVTLAATQPTTKKHLQRIDLNTLNPWNGGILITHTHHIKAVCISCAVIARVFVRSRHYKCKVCVYIGVRSMCGFYIGNSMRFSIPPTITHHHRHTHQHRAHMKCRARYLSVTHNTYIQHAEHTQQPVRSHTSYEVCKPQANI